ncbi:MAG: porin [Rikenellaceae bacterium]
MKKTILALLAVASISTAATAQNSPLEWESNNTKVKIGGFVRFNINSDFAGSVSGGNDFISTNIPTTTDWRDEDYLNFDPSATRLSMEITQSTEALGDVKVYVEGDFRGASNYIPRLRQAYIEAKGVIAGFAWSFMSDLAANAPTIDINGVGSRSFLRTQMVGYRRSLGEGLSAGIALEVPTLKSTYAAGYTDLNQTIPNIPLYIQSKGEAGHIKLSGAIRVLQYGDTSNNQRLDEIGWAGQLSGSLKATTAITLYGQAIYGQGANNYISDLASQSINMMSTNGTDMESTPMGGASVGIGAKLSKKWSAAASGSIAKNYGDEDYFAGSYQSSSYVSAVLFYAPAPKISLGVEYLNGSLTRFGSEAVDAQRLSLSVKYSL